MRCLAVPPAWPCSPAAPLRRRRRRADALLADRLFAPPREAIRTDDVLRAERRDAPLPGGRHRRPDPPRRAAVRPGRCAATAHASSSSSTTRRRTKNAAATFATRTGNCLSLVIMTAAFAKELGVPVRYQAAYLDETWSRTGNLLIASGHVNVTLARRLLDAKTGARPHPADDRLPARRRPARPAHARRRRSDDRRDVRQQPRRRGARRRPPRRRLRLGRRERAPRPGVRRRATTRSA